MAAGFEKELKGKGALNLLKGKILATLFFEPSTRTRLSFEAAMQRLGGGVISMASAESSSAAKGETVADTAMTVAQYADAIVIRHPRIGSAKEAADAADIPVINAGDGAGQHPTQALLDIYTISKELGSLKNLKISLVGDLKNGRTVHALVEILSLYGAKLYFVSPGLLRMPGGNHRPFEVQRGRDRGDGRSGRCRLPDRSRLHDADPERAFQRFGGIRAGQGELRGGREVPAALKKDLTIMHPLPRVDEIHTEVDSYAGAAYFRQVRNGVSVRMAPSGHDLRETVTRMKKIVIALGGQRHQAVESAGDGRGAV